MNYLLDTHMIVWALDDSERLPNRVRSILDDPDKIVCISSASVAEMAIKMSLGKLVFNSDPFEAIKSTRIRDLPFIWRHAR